MKQYGSSLKNFFVFGDLNVVDTSSIFNSLEGFKSMRHVLPKEKTDYEPTFHGFNSVLANLGHLLMKRMVTLDHIFINLRDIVPY